MLGLPQAYALVAPPLEHLQAYVGGSPELLGALPLGGLESYVGVLTGLSLLGIAIQCNLSAFDDEGEPVSPSGPAVDSEESTSTEASADEPDSRGIIYTRVSSRGQVVDGTSLDEQVRNLTALADEWDVGIVETLQDAGQTGRNFDREGIRKCEACNGRVDRIRLRG